MRNSQKSLPAVVSRGSPLCASADVFTSSFPAVLLFPKPAAKTPIRSVALSLPGRAVVGCDKQPGISYLGRSRKPLAEQCHFGIGSEKGESQFSSRLGRCLGVSGSRRKRAFAVVTASR